jgi:hypothetical protein
MDKQIDIFNEERREMNIKLETMRREGVEKDKAIAQLNNKANVVFGELERKVDELEA